MDFRKLEPKFSWRQVSYCALANLAAAGAAFVLSFLVTGSPVLTVLYTLYTWAATVTASFAFWIWWFFRKTKAPAKIRSGFLAIMLVLLIIEWMVIWNVIEMV